MSMFINEKVLFNFYLHFENVVFVFEIVNLWGIVKRKTRHKRPKNADELKATVKESWAAIPPQQCHKLITSMPRRIEAVIKAKGARTKYWVHIQ